MTRNRLAQSFTTQTDLKPVASLGGPPSSSRKKKTGLAVAHDGNKIAIKRKNATTAANDSDASVGPLVRCNVLRHPSQILVKQIEEDSDGILKKTAGGKIPRGSLISTETKPLRNYIEDAFKGGFSQYALPSNVELGTDIPISPKEFVVAGGVDRSAKTLTYVDGPAPITFDHDPSRFAHLEVMSPKALVDIFMTHFPTAFSTAAWGAYVSSSSFVYGLDGTEHSGMRGFHVVFSVENATEIKAFGERLFKRLWLLGYGYIHISKDGKALPRTIFDTKVIEPQQPLFAGGARCLNCEQRRPAPDWNDGEYIRTEGVPALTDAEEEEYVRVIEEAKHASKPECERIRGVYTQSEIDEFVVQQQVTVTQARRIVESRLAGTLIGSDILLFDDHGAVCVSDVLSTPLKYDESTLADPVDGDVPGKAILYMNATTGVPIVYSHAHGGGCFYLKHNIDSLLSRLAGMTQAEAVDEWAGLVRIADTRPDEMDRFLQAVKAKTHIATGALRQTVKDQSNAGRADILGLTQDPGLFLADLLLKEKYQDGKTLIQLESGSFWHYTGTHWMQIMDSVISGELHKVANAQWQHLLLMWEASKKKSSTLAAVVSSALSSLGSKVVVAGDPLRLNSSRPSVVNCANGELWLSEDAPQLRSHSPQSFLTSCSPITYDVSATAPNFKMAMRGILSHPGGQPMEDQDEMLRHVEELLGYAIQTRRNLKMFILIVGPGDNGKTTFIKVLRYILGDHAIAFDRLAGVNEDGNRFATTRLLGKLAVIDDDVDFGYLLPDGLLKKIAEEKPMTAEGKFKDSHTFIAQVVPILLGNSWPTTRDLTRGMQTRANVLFLPRSFLKPCECDEGHPDRQRPELWESIYANEMAGVLNLLIAGYYRVAARNGFATPPSAQRAFDMWLEEANVVSRFIHEACEKIDPAKPGFTTSMAYEAFQSWAMANGVQQRHRPQQNQLKKRIEELGHRVEHTVHGTGVYGLAIKAEWYWGSNPFVEKPK